MNTSEEEDCDDLPPITVNSSANNSSTFAMPTAEELAEQRARERECERQLEQLRERARDDEQLAALRRSDSSGSEAEQALAAAVTALSVRAARPCAGPALPAAALWAALLPRLPPHAAELQWTAPAAQLRRAVAAVGAALAAERAAWPDDELLTAGALLSVAALAHESRSRRAAARALHALLDDRATPAQEALLTGALLAALPAARARLQLSDALRSGGDGGADRAAFALTAAAMLELLRAPAQDGREGEAVSLERVARAASVWRACDADTRYLCVQLTGRLLAATSGATDATSGITDATSGITNATSGITDATSGITDATSGITDATSGITDATSGITDATSGITDATSGITDATSATLEARARLLAHLAPPPAGASDVHRPDRLKALVGASKLKLLFWAKNGVSKQPLAQRDTST